MHPHPTIRSGKDLLFATLQHEAVPGVPWVPFAGVHAGKLAGYTGREVLTDGGKLLQALMRVNEIYTPDGQPVLFDLQVEAEILGCELVWSENTPPSVLTHPLAQDMIVPTRLPEKTDGRLPMILEAMTRFRQAVGERTALYGLVTGPFTLASHLRGTDIFLDSVDNPDYLGSLLEYANRVCLRLAEYYHAAGMDMIAVVDPLVSQVSPRHFRRFLSEGFTQAFAAIRSLGAFSAFFVCGDATKNIEVMCQTGPDCISIDENIQMGPAKAITDRYNIAIAGNIPLTTRMLFGTQQDNMKYVVDLLETLPPGNLIISPGCDMPYDTPIENTIGALQAVREPEKTRQLLENYHVAEVDIPVALPDYDHLPRPLLEVFTIDSETCPACGYMVRSARHAAQARPGAVDVVEYKLTLPENVARIKKLGIQNLPCIFINGQLRFSSIIPGQRELLEAIDQASHG